MGLTDKIANRNNAPSPFQSPHQSTAPANEDVARILQLPRREYEGFNPRPYQLSECNIKLRDVQCRALECLRVEGSGFFPIGVGWGKTFICLLAGAVMERKHVLILLPSPTIEQMQKEYYRLAKHYKVPSVTFQSYWGLSQRPESEASLNHWLKGKDPKDCLIVCDEAHKLKRREAARTKRLMRFVRDNQEIAVVCLSGTMTTKSLLEYSHLLILCLRERTPLPLKARTLIHWNNVLGVENRPEWYHYKDLEGILQRYDRTCTWAERYSVRRDKARRAFSTHLRGASGIVATDESALGVSLLIGRVTTNSGFSSDLKAVIDQLLETGDSPDGEQTYDDPAEVARVARQLALGFFYRWKWPEGKVDIEWLMARANWNRVVRWELEQKSAEGYDSPRLVREAVGEGRGPLDLQNAYMQWQQHSHKPAPPVEAVWLDDSIIRKAVAYARERGMCVWYQSKAVAAKLAELGMPVFLAGKPVHDASPIPHAYSIAAHGTGLNLQGYDTALVLEPPSSGARWEQMLGRLHRPGQQSDEVSFEFLAHTKALKGALTKGIEDAMYIQATTRNPQKLCAAVYHTTSV